MRQLIITVTTPEGEIIDRQTVEVEHSMEALDVSAREVGNNTSQHVVTLSISGLGATEL